MKLKLHKSENSNGIKNNILKTNDKEIISKVSKEKISLEEKFLKYKGKNLAKEFTWDNPRGKEIVLKSILNYNYNR